MSVDQNDEVEPKSRSKLGLLISGSAEIAGGAVGGVLGFLAGGPAGAALFGAGGAAAGLALRHVGEEIAERLLGPREKFVSAAYLLFRFPR